MRIARALALIVVLPLWLACSEGEVVPMPKELQGAWWSDARGYEGRGLVITALRVRFGTGGESSTDHDVLEVRRLSAYLNDYRISYRVGLEGENWLSVRYDPRRESLRLIHQPQVEWYRKVSEEA